MAQQRSAKQKGKRAYDRGASEEVKEDVARGRTGKRTSRARKGGGGERLAQRSGSREPVRSRGKPGGKTRTTKTQSKGGTAGGRRGATERPKTR